MDAHQHYPLGEGMNGYGNMVLSDSNATEFMPNENLDLNESISFLEDLLIPDFINEPSPDIPLNVTDDPESPFIGQWKTLTELRQNESEFFRNAFSLLWKNVADPLFNFAFRREFSDVIESIRWDRVNVADNEPNGRNMLMARKIAEKLCSSVSHKLESHTEEDYGYQLELQKSKLQDPHFNLWIVQLMQNILQEEARIIYTETQQPNTPKMSNANGYHCKEEFVVKSEPNNDAYTRGTIIQQELSELETVSQSSTVAIKHLDSKVRSLQLSLGGKLAYIDQFNRSDLNRDELQGLAVMKKRRDEIREEEQNVIQQCHWQQIDKLFAVHKKVLNIEIKEWQRNQAFINNGRTMPQYCKISTLQDWCKRMAILISGNLKQMDVLKNLDNELGFWHRQPPPNTHVAWQFIENLMQRYSYLLEELVKNCLVVEEQPPQVLMKEKRFQCRLQHLIGDGLDIHQVLFKVTVTLINKEQANLVLSKGSEYEPGEVGTIVNPEANADFSAHTRILSVTMRNMCLRMQQRGPQREAEIVAELKFALRFRAKIMVRYSQACTNLVTAQTMSLPIVVISHGKQEADAQATIFWDNAFAKIDRPLFSVDKTVLWVDLLNALDGRWRKECQEDNKAVGLTETARKYLTMKLFRQEYVNSGTTITWAKFNHDKMTCGGPHDRKELFTFWTWFFKAMELCSSQYVKKFWNMGVIQGFLSKTDCQKMLLKPRAAGYFLFRFSETKCGAVSISHSAMINGQPSVRHLEPDNIGNFKMRGLADIVMDLTYLQNIYPDRPKIDVFGRYATTKEAPPGYLKKGLVASTGDDIPDTPASSFHCEALSPNTHFPGSHTDTFDDASSMQEDS